MVLQAGVVPQDVHDKCEAAFARVLSEKVGRVRPGVRMGAAAPRVPARQGLTGRPTCPPAGGAA